MKLFKLLFLLSLGFSCISSFSLDKKHYIGGGIQTSMDINFHHQGWNTDKSCYPDMSNCTPNEHEGFTWLYEVMNKWMAGGIIYAGIQADDNWRLELSADGSKASKPSKTKFAGVYYLKEKGRPYEKAPLWKDLLISKKQEELTASLSPAEANKDYTGLYISRSFSEFQIINLMANAYYTVPLKDITANSYIGLGVGYSLVQGHVKYKAQYTDSSLNGLQDETFSTGAPAVRISAGLDYSLGKALFDIKLAYTRIAELNDTLKYEQHLNQESNEMSLVNINYFTAAVTIKYFL